ncbi:hypothetical protein [Vulgatibacter incomptus]|uniref:Lipoprotein n=1 Tax=Vulgatibacter incomptus TaxID=1391653 RepID=A0A0K1PB50_9BACT|nr:hypothetical protein [Vulgatibacter incomptus]AKU90354.1 hypothetical protein AKJ08_0741 [Vulgatibacter incomptus]
MKHRRIVGVLTLLLASCSFPDVPSSSKPDVGHRQSFPAPGREQQSAGRTYESIGPSPGSLENPGRTPNEAGLTSPADGARPIAGKLVGNAVSSVVIATDGGLLTLQIVPGTELYIGDTRVGLREIQPGTDVRATYLARPDYPVAVRIDATPGKVGWRESR